MDKARRIEIINKIIITVFGSLIVLCLLWPVAVYLREDSAKIETVTVESPKAQTQVLPVEDRKMTEAECREMVRMALNKDKFVEIVDGKIVKDKANLRLLDGGGKRQCRTKNIIILEIGLKRQTMDLADL